MEWGERESGDSKEHARIIERDFPRIKLYEQQGMTHEEACAKVCSELTPEELAVWERVFERINNEVECFRREWRERDKQVEKVWHEPINKRAALIAWQIVMERGQIGEALTAVRAPRAINDATDYEAYKAAYGNALRAVYSSIVLFVIDNPADDDGIVENMASMGVVFPPKKEVAG